MTTDISKRFTKPTPLGDDTELLGGRTAEQWDQALLGEMERQLGELKDQVASRIGEPEKPLPESGDLASGARKLFAK